MNELLIFAKYPEPGQVKTRLARTIGAVEAARRYGIMVETVIQKTDLLPPTPSLACPERGRRKGRGKPVLSEAEGGEGEYRRVLCFDPPQRENDFRKWFPSLKMRPQCDGDLGRRMFVAFQESLASGSNRAVLIGTDCIEIDQSLLCGAFDRLDKTDLVLGPAKDGGYYLIGMKKAYPFLFEGIPWSTDQVFTTALEKAQAAGLAVELLTELSDVDVF